MPCGWTKSLNNIWINYQKAFILKKKNPFSREFPLCSNIAIKKKNGCCKHYPKSSSKIKGSLYYNSYEYFFPHLQNMNNFEGTYVGTKTIVFTSFQGFRVSVDSVRPFRHLFWKKNNQFSRGFPLLNIIFRISFFFPTDRVFLWQYNLVFKSYRKLKKAWRLPLYLVPVLGN